MKTYWVPKGYCPLQMRVDVQDEIAGKEIRYSYGCVQHLLGICDTVRYESPLFLGFKAERDENGNVTSEATAIRLEPLADCNYREVDIIANDVYNRSIAREVEVVIFAMESERKAEP